jgi:nitrogen-specific signal transduction histidine kinase
VETQELLYANRAAMNNSQLRGSYSGHTCYNYMFGKKHVCEDCQLKRLQMDGKQELVRHDKDGDRYLNIEKKGISWYGHFACAHFINDVTEKKRNERMLAVEREASAKAAFVSNVSHDMRTPLNGILGFIELALQSKGKDEREEYLEKIRTTGKFMLNLINETLDLSKISSGKLEIEPENSNMQELLDTIIVSAYANAEVKKVQFITELADMHFQDVYVDVLKLQKVILNLLSNAIKYTPAGGSVTMCMEGPADFGAYNCHIVISDTGVGMDKSFLPKLFEPFSQERTSITRKIEGTGLGMSIVKSLVDLMGGKITVDSERGKGTRFDMWFFLPPGQTSEAAEVPVDGELMQLVNRRILHRDKVPVELAGDGQRLLRHVRHLHAPQMGAEDAFDGVVVKSAHADGARFHSAAHNPLHEIRLQDSREVCADSARGGDGVFVVLEGAETFADRHPADDGIRDHGGVHALRHYGIQAQGAAELLHSGTCRLHIFLVQGATDVMLSVEGRI